MLQIKKNSDDNIDKNDGKQKEKSQLVLYSIRKINKHTRHKNNNKR